MSECKTVTLRTRPLKKGMLSFYLDYYPGYRDQETMKTIRHEGLNIYIYANPKNQRERDFNAAMWKSHATLPLLAKQDCPLWLQYD